MKNLPRNASTALVMGAAGFIGSHLVERLLEKGVSVIGVDDLSTGKKSNLFEASKQSQFFSLYQSGEKDLPDDISKIDYAFLVINDQIDQPIYQHVVDNFVRLVKKYHSKVNLISSISQYNNEDKNPNLEYAEKVFAQLAETEINYRIVRLAPVYGPRMPILPHNHLGQLIAASLKNDLANLQLPLDLTIRGIFVSDVVELIIKSTFHGSTVGKTYDGALLHPVKLDELKQQLSNPGWSHSQSLELTQLPAWPTPNLLKTERELNWHPRVDLLSALKQTATYFKDHPEALEVKQPQSKPVEAAKTAPVEELFHPEYILDQSVAKSKRRTQLVLPRLDLSSRLPLVKSVGLSICGVALITLALVVPSGQIILAGLNIENQLGSAPSLTDYNLARSQIDQSQQAVGEMESLIDSLNFLKVSGALGQPINSADQLVQLLSETTEATNHFVEASQNISQLLQISTGQSQQNIESQGDQASLQLDQAERELAHLTSRLADPTFRLQMPELIKPKLTELKGRVDWFYNLTDQMRGLVQIFNLAILKQNSASYLVLVEDPSQLSSGGGVARSFAVFEFNQGKLARGFKFAPADFLAVDPTSSNQINNSAYDLDFPTNSQRLEAIYQTKFNKGLDGVVVLDLKALQSLAKFSGLATGGDLHTQDDSRLSDLTQQVFQQLFYLANPNWPGQIGEVNQLLSQKDIIIYSNQPQVQVVLRANDWMGEINRTPLKVGENLNYLAILETGKSGQVLPNPPTKSVEVTDQIGEDGKRGEQIVINYNSSTDSQFESRLYFPSSASLNQIQVDGVDQLKQTGRISDYGKAGLIIPINLTANQPTEVQINIEDSQPTSFDDQGLAKFSLNLTKQPGAATYPFNYLLTFPSTYNLQSQIGFTVDQGQLKINHPLNSDLKASAIFKK